MIAVFPRSMPVASCLNLYPLHHALTSAAKQLVWLLALLVGIGVGSLPLTAAIAQELDAQPTTASLSSPLPDGVYLYGDVPEANQIGATYLVMSIQQGQTTGAFYQPFSDFDCFRGQVTETALLLTITNSHDQTTYPYALPLSDRQTIASQQGGTAQVIPTGYHRLGAPSEQDQAILETCRQAYGRTL